MFGVSKSMTSWFHCKQHTHTHNTREQKAFDAINRKTQSTVRFTLLNLVMKQWQLKWMKVIRQYANKTDNEQWFPIYVRLILFILYIYYIFIYPTFSLIILNKFIYQMNDDFLMRDKTKKYMRINWYFLSSAVRCRIWQIELVLSILMWKYCAIVWISMSERQK